MSLSFTFENQQQQHKQTVTSGIQEHGQRKSIGAYILESKIYSAISVCANGNEVQWFYL